jgi:activator of HSP90 ATPase
MTEEFTLHTTLPAGPEAIYRAWLSPDGHAAMTGSPARVEGRPNGAFTAWDGYIWGTFIELEENRRILQTWRTSECPQDAGDSHVELLVEPRGSSTEITLRHWDFPDGQAASYKQGWENFYFKPMRLYFA